VAARLLEAWPEIGALAMDMIEEMQLGIEAGRDSWTWAGVQQAHEATDEPERADAWQAIIEGRQIRAAEEAWEQMSTVLDEHLRS